ncbi:putative circularly permuted ATP-grasp superfamily protein [Fluviicoccus keumensis]|uniref:Putative circularly permuted ATP-grasp superfamily protein n=1 Tax=Fluviicoccus keumensis TaxID=1435465 RepID=A0A4Q7YNR5_9GAMM|nr:circularly permuted type 2 ATP-grasp protein [Fluviicoccus keumensis]RZU38295.1 putative circularly permuted ATP-grasp superfamily protein [Fluviicoccus keumensis]
MNDVLIHHARALARQRARPGVPETTRAMTDLFAALPDEPDRYHEIFTAEGEVHPHWRDFHALLAAMTPEQMQHRTELVERLVQENGITYNIYSTATDTSRPWRLGSVPNLIPAAEWQEIAAGIAQRADLLNRVLADLYGPQTLLAEGLLPPELVFGHNNFLWPCRGMQPPGGLFLHVYAADLARGPDGHWSVMADRTQAPSGMGYALENRQIVARAFPELYKQLQVQSLTGFFQALQQTLARLAPTRGEPPLIVLLTPGRYNETYFEHVYLARQLAMPLVEGSDLTVRQSVVYLKTLNGLKRVHAILRRLDDDFCDPLELRSDSALGVPGLLEAARAGTVLIANALGSGVLETPGLHGFLPRIAEFLLGEALEMPSLDTWWCGEAPALEEALERLPELVIKPTFPSQRFDPVFGKSLDKAGLAEMRRRIARRPYAYVAQELKKLSLAPVWQSREGRFTARSAAMRVYAVATEKGWLVMPGGLTRVAGKEAQEVVSMQRGGISKDTWVCFSPSTRRETPAVRPLGVSDLLRQDPYLPSRVAENMFWLGRYAERCDNNARLLRSALSRLVEVAGDDDSGLEVALDTCRFLGLLEEDDDPALKLTASLCESEGGSLRGSLGSLIWCASQVRSRLSHENWIAIVDLEQEADRLQPGVMAIGDSLVFLDRLLMSLSSLAGFAMDDMTQDNSWRFLMIGRRLERLQFLASAIARLLETPAATGRTGLDWLLELADSTITYRSRYLSTAQLIPVLDLILLDPANPHALIYQLDKLVSSLRQVGDDEDYGLAAIRDQLATLDLGVLESEMQYPARLPKALAILARLLRDIAAAGLGLSDQLTLRYFAHVDSISQPTVST